MRLRSLLLAAVFSAAISSSSARAADILETLSGRWSVQKTNSEGQAYTQTITVKKDKFVYQIMGATDRLVLYAEGDLKLEKLGSFNIARFTSLRAGGSAAQLRDVDDEYVSIFRLEQDQWTLATGFDKDRDRQKPSVDCYHRLQQVPEPRTLVIDEIEMADTPQSATWYLCFEARVDAVSNSYHLDGKGYDKNQVTVPMGLELSKIRAGQKCSFKVQLDDVDEDVCTQEVDNSSVGEFVIDEKGAQTFKPEDSWRYTIRWHLK